MSLPSLYDLEAAVRNARRYAMHLHDTAKRADDYDRARESTRIAQQGEQAMRQLSSMWSEIKSLMAARDRAYDQYVTSRQECCSCHITAPCSYCTDQSEETGHGDDA